jgi:hypothetical protein
MVQKYVEQTLNIKDVKQTLGTEGVKQMLDTKDVKQTLGNENSKHMLSVVERNRCSEMMFYI